LRRQRSASRKRRFPLIRFKDFLLDTSASYLVDELIPRSGLVVVWGPPKCGKSFWVFDLVMHVALGIPYRGREVHQGTVVYVACEGVKGPSAPKRFA
jgi:RecA-family ATPase